MCVRVHTCVCVCLCASVRACVRVQHCIATYEGALKKFHGAASIWQAYASWLYTQPAQVSAARDLLKRALARCDKSEHVSLLTRWAALEFHVARNVDRGRTLMEGVLAAYPKRVDLWAVYIDQEVKLAKHMAEAQAEGAPTTAALTPEQRAASLNHDSVRRLFERVTALAVSSKKMKYFFQRWLHFEKEYGGADAQRIEHVKHRARAFVASKAAAHNEGE